jgi:hypothetical protein
MTIFSYWVSILPICHGHILVTVLADTCNYELFKPPYLFWGLESNEMEGNQLNSLQMAVTINITLVLTVHGHITVLCSACHAASKLWRVVCLVSRMAANKDVCLVWTILFDGKQKCINCCGPRVSCFQFRCLQFLWDECRCLGIQVVLLFIDIILPKEL